MIKPVANKEQRSESRANGKRGADSGKPHHKPLPNESTGREIQVSEDSALQQQSSAESDPMMELLTTSFLQTPLPRLQ